jgi:hypothetical protein
MSICRGSILFVWKETDHMKTKCSHTALRKIGEFTMLGVFMTLLFTLSGHSLIVSGQQSNPDLSGNWESKYKPDSNWADASITQEGQSLTFHNENGGKSKGRFVSPNQVVADDWENGLRARVTDDGNRLEWANGSVWRRKATTALAGNWESKYKPDSNWADASITQEGKSLTFHNERGDKSRGRFLSSHEVVADDWENGLRAQVTDGGNRLEWANGSVWRKKSTPSLAGNWEINKGRWELTTIRQEGRKLWFTNEFGDTSEGFFESQTRVKATKWEGGLGATIENGNIIKWDNGTIWRRR